MIKIGEDKKLHITCCLLVAAFIGSILAVSHTALWVIAFISFISAMLCGLAKEYGDHINPHNKWDWYDIVADGVGALLGSIIVLLAVLLF